MGKLKVITTRVLALEMANTSRGTKGKANVIWNVGSLGFRPTWPSYCLSMSSIDLDLV